MNCGSRIADCLPRRSPGVAKADGLRRPRAVACVTTHNPVIADVGQSGSAYSEIRNPKSEIAAGGTWLAVLLALAVAAACAATFAQEPSLEASPAATAESGGVDKPLRSLWRESISIVGSPDAKQAFDQAVRDLESIDIASPKPKTPQPATAASAPAVVKHDLSPETIQQLRKLAPEAVDNPLELADALFNAGQMAAAEVFYELATKKPSSDAGWVLLQLANCKLAADRDQAAKLYGRVIREHGQSSWAKAADARLKLIEFSRDSQPQATIDEARRLTQELAGGRQLPLREIAAPGSAQPTTSGGPKQ